MLIDTCVWLDLAKDQKQAPLLGVVEEMVRLGLISLVVPRVILDEFQQNRERVAKESAKSLSTHFRLVKEAVNRAPGGRKKARLILSYLDDVGHKIPIVGGAAAGVLDRIARLLAASPIIEASQPVKLLATERALDRRAPLHRDKNAVADAIIIETYAACLQDKTALGVRFAFVTHNTADFSAVDGTQKRPHPDLAGLFSRVKSLYFINLAEALRRVEPSLVTDVMLEQSSIQEPRGLGEILEAEDLLFHQVWYNRHWSLQVGVEEGRIKVVDKEAYPRPRDSPETIQRDVWRTASTAAQEVERRYGKENLGPWSDFEWGMVNGKLSALRWALGDEWDMLDT